MARLGIYGRCPQVRREKLWKTFNGSLRIPALGPKSQGQSRVRGGALFPRGPSPAPRAETGGSLQIEKTGGRENGYVWAVPSLRFQVSEETEEPGRRLQIGSASVTAFNCVAALAFRSVARTIVERGSKAFHRGADLFWGGRGGKVCVAVERSAAWPVKR